MGLAGFWFTMLADTRMLRLSANVLLVKSTQLFNRLVSLVGNQNLIWGKFKATLFRADRCSKFWISPLSCQRKYPLC